MAAICIGLLVASCSSTETVEAPGSSAALDVSTKSVEPTTTPATVATSAPSSAGPQFDSVITVVLENDDQFVPLLDQLESLTPKFFTEDTGITVNFVRIEDIDWGCNIDCRPNGTIVSGEEFVSQAAPLDVVSFDSFTVHRTRLMGRLTDLKQLADQDPDYDADDFLPNVMSSLGSDQFVAAPFAAESSMLMVNQELLDAAGLDVSENPTWSEVAEIARQVHSDEAAGVCLRGAPGWDQAGAPLTTLVNAFGGTWWDDPGPRATNDFERQFFAGEAQINPQDSGFRAAAQFYVDLLQDAGPPNVTDFGFVECLDAFRAGTVALWYDSTLAAIHVALDPGVAGDNVTYRPSPVGEATDVTGWLNVMALAINRGSEEVDAAWEFVAWATSDEYAALAAANSPAGWAGAPTGTRESIRNNPGYIEDTATTGQRIFDSIEQAPFTNPGTTPQAGFGGVHFVGILPFIPTANLCTTELAAVIDGTTNLDTALDRCQQAADTLKE